MGGVFPENVVAADRDASGSGEFDHGVGDGVVFDASGSLGGVPFELVFEDGVLEPRREPVLVSGVVENVLVDGTPQGEARLPEIYRNGGVRDGPALLIDGLKPYPSLACLDYSKR